MNRLIEMGAFCIVSNTNNHQALINDGMVKLNLLTGVARDDLESDGEVALAAVVRAFYPGVQALKGSTGICARDWIVTPGREPRSL